MADRKRKRQQYRAEHREQKTSRPAAPPRVTWEIQRGWKVYTADSETLGAVGEVSPADDYFVVSGGFLLRRHTVYVPMRYVRGAGQGRISLRVTKAEALKWRQPPPARRPLTDDTGASLRVAPRVRPVTPPGLSEAPAPTGSSGAAPERSNTGQPAPLVTVASRDLPPAPVASGAPEQLSAARAPSGRPVELVTSTPADQLSTPLAAPDHARAPTEVVGHQAPAPAAPIEMTQAEQSDQAGDRSLGEIKAAAVQRFEERLEALVRHDSHEPSAESGEAMPARAPGLVEIAPSPAGGAVQDPQDSATVITEKPAD